MMTPGVLLGTALALVALALAVLGAGLLARQRRAGRAARHLEAAAHQRAQAVRPAGAVPPTAPDDAGVPWLAGFARWLETPPGRALLADEDRDLIDRCGFPAATARPAFLLARLATSLGLPLVAAVLFDNGSGGRLLAALFVAFCLGYFIPKWWLRAYAGRRRERMTDELPLFVDLIRLLQGVGLGIDQSLQVAAGEFRSVLPVLGQELDIANRRYASGIARAQSLARLVRISGSEEMEAVIGLLVQVDRHGGGVQGPLTQFAERLREKRRMQLKERIGKITVKMTGVMVLTLLPALLVITAGPGFIAVIRALGRMGGGQ